MFWRMLPTYGYLIKLANGEVTALFDGPNASLPAVHSTPWRSVCARDVHYRNGNDE